jgi:uncharacterized protein YydD (DUF2326 family)
MTGVVQTLAATEAKLSGTLQDVSRLNTALLECEKLAESRERDRREAITLLDRRSTDLETLEGTELCCTAHMAVEEYKQLAAKYKQSASENHELQSSVQEAMARIHDLQARRRSCSSHGTR